MMGIEWLPEEVDPETGEGRPKRPDLPWMRNLSWTKLHAMQIGFFVALIVYWGQAIGMGGVAFGFTLVVVKYALGVRKPKQSCDHSLGFHDVREKPWYAMTAALATYVGFVVVAGCPV